MFKRKKSEQPVTIDDPIKLLQRTSPWNMDVNERSQMTISCKDSDYIPKVRGAGSVKKLKGLEYQLMHNGTKVVLGGYHGEWMADIIKTLKGHHEPQEEKAFYEVIKKLGKAPTIIELGSFWSYYSIWLLNVFPKAKAIACEPDPHNMEIGKANAQLNQVTTRINFIPAAAGSDDHKKVTFRLDSNPAQKIEAEIRTVDSLFKQYLLDKIDILHMDVQGVELSALEGALNTIKKRAIRFVFISTHHYSFSGDPLTHQKCKKFLLEQGAHIIAAHTVLESFSGDGLIVASFDKRDKDFKIELSLNHTDNSLFRSYEEDIALMADIVREVTSKV